MILSERVEINVHTKNVSFLRENGYDVNIGDIIKTDINMLPTKSHILVDVKCDICGEEKKIQYRYYNDSIQKYGYYTCSAKCAISKNKRTNLEKYGVENVSKSEIIKEKKQKTTYDNFGVKSPFESSDIKNKIKKTNLEKYGVENVSKSEIIKQKVKKTNLEKYGNEIFVNSDYFYENVSYFRLSDNPKFFDTIKTKLKDKYNIDLYNIYRNNENKIIYNIKCDNNCDHDFECESDMLSHRIKYNTILCTKCNPKNSYTKSGLEIKILNFIKDNYTGKILENYRINNNEIDIYLPDLNIGFEVNGLWWHNELYMNKNYHKNKKDICFDNDINLFFIYEDEWIYKQDIVKSMILHKLKKTKIKIYARKCSIKIVSNSETIKFLNNNHIQGNANSSINIGLYYDSELISVMTFNKRRLGIGKNCDGIELVRYCNKLNTNVVGGANKLFKHFIDNYSYSKIISFANLDYSNGDIYFILGFRLIEKQNPNYYYVYDKVRKHRFNFRKDKLIKDGYDPDKSEHEIMLERKIYRIYNSGILKFEYC